MPHTAEALFKVAVLTHPQSESTGVPARSGRGMPRTQDMMSYPFIFPHPFGHFLTPFLFGFPSKKYLSPRFLADQGYANRAGHAGYTSSLRRRGRRNAFGGSAMARTRAQGSRSLLAAATAGSGSAAGCRRAAEGARLCQRGFGVPAGYGEVRGSQKGCAKHLGIPHQCCRSGREHKSGRRVAPGGGR